MAQDLVQKSDGKLVDRGGALATTIRRVLDPGNPAKGRERHRLHALRTAATRDLADIRYLVKNPDVVRVAVVPSGRGGRTNDLDVEWIDGSRSRWETTTATGAPDVRRSTRPDADPLVTARSERIPRTAAERREVLARAIDGKPTQLGARRKDGYPTGGTLSIHAPFAKPTRADCDQVIIDKTPKLSADEREVVIWRLERDPDTQHLRNVGERYVRQGDDTYRHGGTVRHEPGTATGRADGKPVAEPGAGKGAGSRIDMTPMQAGVEKRTASEGAAKKPIHDSVGKRPVGEQVANKPVRDPAVSRPVPPIKRH